MEKPHSQSSLRAIATQINTRGFSVQSLTLSHLSGVITRLYDPFIDQEAPVVQGTTASMEYSTRVFTRSPAGVLRFDPISNNVVMAYNFGSG
mmetsp:Transcript_31605/g.66049  ORF Transcript_31605/g.66049 Transcript_31605/m.66049 type:complete len:92 (+) Transcript_31605:547-822(+)